MNQAKIAGNSSPAATESFPGWTPVQIAKHYKFPLSEYDGAGQSIAIISLGGQLDMDELKKDFKGLRIPFPAIRVVDVLPQDISSQQNAMPTGETHLDVEVIGSLCPAAKITIYRGPNPYGFASAIQKAVEDGNDVISISWGGPEVASDQQGEMERVLADAASKGITVTVAAGDGGSSDHRGASGGAAAAPDGLAHADYPASSPYVLACGGTELILDNGTYYEAVWNNSSRNGGASGGGVSEFFGTPKWQSDAGIEIANVNTGRMGRVIPDVTGLAAGGDWVIYQSGQSEGIGGTSAVAPLWASFIALANQARKKAGKANLGYINERLYTLASKDNNLFNDIVYGNNKSGSDAYPGYSASKGFDACSGWGTPVGDKLFAALVALD